MECKGKFKFKGITKKDGGKFIDKNGKEINYKPSYVLKLDETIEDNIYERSFKVAEDSSLIPELYQLKPYQDIVVTFDLIFYLNQIKLIPISVTK